MWTKHSIWGWQKKVPQGPTEPRGTSTSKQKPQMELPCELENGMSGAAWEVRLDGRSTFGKAVAKLTHPLAKCMKGKSLTARQYKDRKGRKKEGKEEAPWEIWKGGRKGEGLFYPLKKKITQSITYLGFRIRLEMVKSSYVTKDCGLWQFSYLTKLW